MVMVTVTGCRDSGHGSRSRDIYFSNASDKAVYLVHVGRLVRPCVLYAFHAFGESLEDDDCQRLLPPIFPERSNLLSKLQGVASR